MSSQTSAAGRQNVHAADAIGGANAYGGFSADGREYVIRNYRTPRPWSNVISNPRVGLAVSQTGSGFSWIDNSQLAVITRWQQEFAQDSSGKFLYIRDAHSDALWSLTPAPTFPDYSEFECRHGIGYTTFRTVMNGIRAEWTMFVHADETVELWHVTLENLTDQPRRLELSAVLEWCCGVNPSPRREFHKLFIETAYDPERRAILAWNHMWDVHSERYGHWNTDFPFVSGLSCTEPVLSAQGDKAAFLGRCGDWARPVGLREDLWKPRFGRHEDAVAVLRSVVELRPRQSRKIGYALLTDGSREAVTRRLDRWQPPQGTGRAVEWIEESLAAVKAGWRERLSAQRIETPDRTMDALVNDWIRYQAISGRIWGRAGYYQQSGAYGFRDQLQDSQVWLTIDPAQTRKQLEMHAAHQFVDGSVYHWWHPLSEQGHVTKMTDDLLWLGFVTANYIRETGQLGVLSAAAPFIDDPNKHALAEHVLRAFQRVFKRTSPRGLPYIGAGDWNDGLSAVGLQERGESIWLGHFLAGLLAEWSEIFRRAGQASPGIAVPPAAGSAGWSDLALDFGQRHKKLVGAINEHGWDGRWYFRATLDDGSRIGSSRNRVGRIFLNAQTWAVLNDVAPPDRGAMCMSAVKEHLIGEMGSLLLAPAYSEPAPEIGYITRYAPGLRENGGVYTHAATWAIAAACKMRDHELVGRLLTAINPANKDPERYWAEPYVLPGNVDGPISPYPGRGGWTWYTGAAQWLHRVVTQWVLGVRPEWDGLRIDPCLPPGWNHAAMARPWRGCTYRIRIERVAPAELPSGQTCVVTLDGAAVPGGLLPVPARPGMAHEVVARCS